ncbi:MAG: CCA tRNA nucleotidyltransferase [Alphaproteobacteria bacterium]|nr:CCA tRNA nucleotidyltransferase [Alphaproteobacteria bacterium]
MIQLWTPDILKINDLLCNQMRLVGGCVRDFLLGQKPQDIDIATTVSPKEVLNLLRQGHIQCRPITLKHGVVQAVLNEKKFEITTLRREYYINNQEKTEFITDYEEDARRRDFTINALYMDSNGVIYDYFGGQSDLEKRIVRFIGDPAVRMKEDALRILRYIRFWADFGEIEPDKTVTQLFQNLKNGLKSISLNRKQKELKRILTCRRVMPALTIMRETGILNEIVSDSDIDAFHLFLQQNPKASDRDRLARLGKLITE